MREKILTGNQVDQSHRSGNQLVMEGGLCISWCVEREYTAVRADLLWRCVQAMNKIPFLPKRERLIHIVTYAVPVAPGRSRVIYRFTKNFFALPSVSRLG
jgi:hypothetical protein